MYVVLIFMTFKRFFRLEHQIVFIQKNDSTQTQPSVCQLLLLYRRNGGKYMVFK